MLLLKKNIANVFTWIILYSTFLFSIQVPHSFIPGQFENSDNQDLSIVSVQVENIFSSNIHQKVSRGNHYFNSSLLKLQYFQSTYSNSNHRQFLGFLENISVPIQSVFFSCSRSLRSPPTLV